MSRHQSASPSSGPTRSVLLTGFDPFGGSTLNPSWLAVQALHDQLIGGHKVIAAQLPTAFTDSLKTLYGLLETHRPALVICVGQAGGRNALSLERTAINIVDASIADNAGLQPIDQPVIEGGPTGYFSTLPIKATLRALEQAGIPAEISQTAGTFVCNHVFYGLMHALAGETLKGTRGGFIHVPYLSSQGLPFMPLEDMIRGIHIAVECGFGQHEDLLLGAGSLA